MDISSDIYSIPLGEGSWLVYAPLQGVAFAATEGLVVALSKLLTGAGGGPEADTGLLAFAGHLGLFERPAEPITVFDGGPNLPMSPSS